MITDVMRCSTSVSRRNASVGFFVGDLFFVGGACKEIDRVVAGGDLVATTGHVSGKPVSDKVVPYANRGGMVDKKTITIMTNWPNLIFALALARFIPRSSSIN